MYTVIGFYKFKRIKSLKRQKSFFLDRIIKNKVRGTIIISSEGINGTISGLKKDVNLI